MLSRTLKTQLVCGVAATALLATATISSADAAAVRSGFNTSTLAANDDGSTGFVSFGFGADINFFGTNYGGGFVNNNGNLTFGNDLGTFPPFNLTGNTGIPIIAPFFADVDTRTNGDPDSAPVRYGTGTVDGRDAFGVSYVDVGYFSVQADRFNSFQLVIIDRSDLGAGFFDIEFNYDEITWEAGSASGGSGGCGGTSAFVGYSAGTGAAGTFAQLAGSGVNGGLVDEGSACDTGNANATTSLVANSLNSNVDGRYIFQVREGGIVEEPIIDDQRDDVPEPGTLALFGLGLLGFAGLRRRLSRG